MTASNYNKRTNLLLVLSGIFITSAILAELIGVKIFSLETMLNAPPAGIKLFDNLVLDFNLTAGVTIWPIVFIITDVINEYFGKMGVRKVSFLTAGMIALAFIIITIVSELPPAAFWLEVNSVDHAGNAFDINFAFTTIYRQGLGIIIGSLVAFLIGQLIDAATFQYLRRITGNKKVWLRSTGSTLISQLLDSFVVLTIAFYVFGDWSLNQVIAVGIINYIYKFFVAVVLTPAIYLAHYVIDRYLGEELMTAMKKKAMSNQSFFQERKT